MPQCNDCAGCINFHGNSVVTKVTHAIPTLTRYLLTHNQYGYTLKHLEPKPYPTATDTLQCSLVQHNSNVVCTILNMILSGFSGVTRTQSNDNQEGQKSEKRSKKNLNAPAKD